MNGKKVRAIRKSIKNADDKVYKLDPRDVKNGETLILDERCGRARYQKLKTAVKKAKYVN